MKRKKTPQPSPNIRIYGPLLKALRDAAERDGRTVNAMAVRLIQQGLAA